MDAGLAKILNSTVGTNNIKSLDKIFTDSIRLVGSEDVMYVYDGAFTSRYQAEYLVNTLTANQYITFDTPGAVRLKTEQIIYANSDANAGEGKPVKIGLQVLNESGTVIASAETAYTSTSMVAIELWVDLNVVPGTKYKLRLTSRSFGESTWASYMSKKVSVCGKAVLFGAKVTPTA